MTQYALVKDGTILEYRNYAPNVDQSTLHPNKPRMLPVVDEDAEYDPVTEARDGPEIMVEESRVVRQYTVRAKNEDEIAAMAQAKCDEIEAEFQRRFRLPIDYLVDGEQHQWHSDDEAITNIMGVLLSYQAAAGLGAPLPETRTWVPYESMTPISVTHAQLAGLGLAIAGRKDALFYVKKAKQIAVLALTDPAEIDAYDATAGWEF